jgi:hypothetical protein
VVKLDFGIAFRGDAVGRSVDARGGGYRRWVGVLVGGRVGERGR